MADNRRFRSLCQRLPNRVSPDKCLSVPEEQFGGLAWAVPPGVTIDTPPKVAFKASVAGILKGEDEVRKLADASA